MKTLALLLSGFALSMSAFGAQSYTPLPDFEAKVRQGSLNRSEISVLSPIVGLKEASTFAVIPSADARTQNSPTLVIDSQALQASRNIRKAALDLVGESILKTYMTASEKVAWLNLMLLSEEDPRASEQLTLQLKRWELVRDRQQQLIVRRAELVTADRKNYLYTVIRENLLPFKPELASIKPTDAAFISSWFADWEMLRAKTFGEIKFHFGFFNAEQTKALSHYQELIPQISILYPTSANLEANLDANADFFAGLDVRPDPNSDLEFSVRIALTESGMDSILTSGAEYLLPLSLKGSFTYGSTGLTLVNSLQNSVCLVSDIPDTIRFCD